MEHIIRNFAKYEKQVGCGVHTFQPGTSIIFLYISIKQPGQKGLDKLVNQSVLCYIVLGTSNLILISKSQKYSLCSNGRMGYCPLIICGLLLHFLFITPSVPNFYGW